MTKNHIPTNLILDELARLRKDIDNLMRKEERVSSIYSGKTTKAERQALRNHIEDLDRELAKKKAQKIIKQNTFNVGQIVELINSPIRIKGEIQYIACKLALPSTIEKVKTVMRAIKDEESINSKIPQVCDKKICSHDIRSYVWVRWQDQKLFAYHFSKLKLMSEDRLKPSIGRELSGRIGPWVYDADTKLWKKDGSDKEYTNDEFADELYFETHPYAKDDGADFIKRLKNS